MDDTIRLGLETIAQNKQAIVFCASRASAEKTAEDIATKRSITNFEAKELALEISSSCLNVVSPPTKQCKRLAKMLTKQIAFHHSGLASKQKDTIETEFKKGNIKIICATPTLAAGLSLPVFRVICKSLKRFSGRFGMNWIPTLEYLQMAGRAGRPEYEKFGEAIAIAKSDGEKDEIYQKYICGQPEEIYSKLNVEPVLRMYVLSLIASGLIKDTKQLSEFFAKTFWAHQFGDLDELQSVIERVIQKLQEWNFVLLGDQEEAQASSTNPTLSKNKNYESKKETNNLFTSALDLAAKVTKIPVTIKKGNSKNKRLKATQLGRRVSELYLDPLTASELINSLQQAQVWINKATEDQTHKLPNEFSYLQSISNTIEMQPLIRIKAKEQEEYNNILLQHYEELLQEEPDVFDLDYTDFMNSVKTAEFFQKWINETTEDKLFNEMNVRPGEIRVKLENANWLLYACYEITKVLGYKEQQAPLQRLRTRVKYGVRKELLSLMKFKGIGRNRARVLYNNNFKTIADLRNADQSDLAALIGPKIAASLKDQLGQKVEPVKKRTRKGQLSLSKF
ncbi:hypothetical protein CL619_01205 [archaeon]|nr:hypothetical protein [archaeon]